MEVERGDEPVDADNEQALGISKKTSGEGWLVRRVVDLDVGHSARASRSTAECFENRP